MGFWLVAVGGAFGASLRFFAQYRYDGSSFPWGTLACNLLGCFIIGMILPQIKSGSLFKELVIFGCLGAFTTFSSFAWQLMKMLEVSEFKLAASYWLVSSFGTVICCYFGYALSKIWTS